MGKKGQNWRKQIGKRLQGLRKDKEFTQEQAGQLLGLTRTSIINMENGRHLPTLEGLLKICAVYKVTPNDILRVPKGDIKDIVVTERKVIVKKRIKKSAKFKFV